MTYVDQWKKIAGRIRGLSQAGHLHAQFLRVRSADTYGRARRLREQCEQVLGDLEVYRATYAQSLPPLGAACVDRFVSNQGALIRDGSGTADAIEERVWAALVFLGAFDAELSFLLADAQEAIRAQSELAFAHLQRSIVADADMRRKWTEAFEDGELRCERLGATHLLSHGIFAFKVSGEGERTDLVFQDVRIGAGDEPGFVDGLVLTEWKVCKTGDNPAKRFDEARRQGQRYGKGVLGGVELTGYRYAVIVSEKHVAVPSDQVIDSVTYRHINIVVAPDPPSRG
jgi:hypothetical protein